MQQNVFLSIVVPTYNRADLIAKTLATLQKQAYEPYEIIVVDDGSTDDTEGIVTSMLNDKTTYHKKNNAERAAARNFGAMLAKGRYINFFDSDDLALENHLSAAANLIAEKDQPEWFHLGYEWAYPDGTVFSKEDKFTGETLNDKLGGGNCLSCNGVFVRKDIFLENRFNEDRALSASEDYELWMRLAARYPLYYTNTITSVVVDHEARSVRTLNAKKLITRIRLLMQYLKQDDGVMRRYGAGFNRIEMEVNSYIALHLATQPAQKLTSLRYNIKALINSPALLKKRRFYATFKNILLKW